MDLVHEFKTALKNLYKSTPPIPRFKIELVASVAIKANKMYKHVVMYLEKYAEKIPAKYKLTALCVIDSIIRQSRKEFGRHKDLYGPRFRKKLKFIFRFLKKCKQRDKAHMVRILTLWQKHLIYTSEVVEPLLSIISPELKSPKKPNPPPEKPYGAAQSVAANALNIIEQQQTQIQALQQLQALKNLNALTPSFVQAIQSLHTHQQLIAQGKEHTIPKELLEQLRLLHSLVQQSADPQPLDYSGLLRSNRKFYQQAQKTHEPIRGYTAAMSSLELPGISGVHPGSPRDRTLAPYRSIKSNHAPPPTRRNHTSLLDDFDYGDDEDDAERIAAQKRRVNLEKKRVEVAARARESARAREKNKRRKKREVRKKKNVPGNATPTQDEVDSPRRYKNQDIDNELERLLLTSSVVEVVRPNGTSQSLSLNDSNEIVFSPISNMNSPVVEQDTFDQSGVSPVSVNIAESDQEEAVLMEEYFARTPSNISEDENQPLVICTEEQRESGGRVNEVVEERSNKDTDSLENLDDLNNGDNSFNDISQEVPLEDAISLPDSANMDDLEMPEVPDSPKLSQDDQEEIVPAESEKDEPNTTADDEKATPIPFSEEATQIPNDTPSPDVEPGLHSTPIHHAEVSCVTPDASGDEKEQLELTAYDPLFPTQDIDEISHASPAPWDNIQSPYASSLEEIFPDFVSSNKYVSPSPSDVSISIKDAISPVTGSQNSSRSSSPPFLTRNPSPPSSPKAHSYPSPERNVNNGFLKSIFDVALPFDNVTPPRDSSSSSCISDVSPPPEENKIESVTPPPSRKSSPLRSLLESVRERVKDMEMIEDIEGYESGKERRIAVTFKKIAKTEKKMLRSVIVVKNNKQSPNTFKSTVQRKKRAMTLSSNSSSLSSCSESSDSIRKRRVKKQRTHKTKKEVRRHVSTHPVKSKPKRPVKSSRVESHSYRQVRRVRSASIDSQEEEEEFPPINKKDFLIIYTNIIKVENRMTVIEKYDLRKYLSTCVGDIELFDIINDRTAALIQLSKRKSADKLKQVLEQADFQCTWVPGFKVLPGFLWNKINGVSCIPWSQITDDPPYNIFSLSKGGTIDFIEIKKELELIDREREREKAVAAETEAAASKETDKPSDQKMVPTRIRLCCQDSEHSDSCD